MGARPLYLYLNYTTIATKYQGEIMEKSTSGGVSFSSMLLILFIALKLVGVIDWPWIWVLAPFWIPLTLGVLVLAIIAILR